MNKKIPIKYKQIKDALTKVNTEFIKWHSSGYKPAVIPNELVETVAYLSDTLYKLERKNNE